MYIFSVSNSSISAAKCINLPGKIQNLAANFFWRPKSKIAALNKRLFSACMPFSAHVTYFHSFIDCVVFIICNSGREIVVYFIFKFLAMFQIKDC